MRSRQRGLCAYGVLVTSLLALACGAPSGPATPTRVAATATAPAAVASPAATAGLSPTPLPSPSPAPAAAVELTVSTDHGDEQRFVPDAIALKPGVEVSLTFMNQSTLPHNLAFQKPMEALTKLVVQPGESDTIRFAAPPPGTYQYLCTIHPTMAGTLTVAP